MATREELREGDIVYIPVPVHGFLGAVDNSPAEILVELHRRYGGETIVRRLLPSDVVTAAELAALRKQAEEHDGMKALSYAELCDCQEASTKLKRDSAKLRAEVEGLHSAARDLLARIGDGAISRIGVDDIREALKEIGGEG